MIVASNRIQVEKDDGLGQSPRRRLPVGWTSASITEQDVSEIAQFIDSTPALEGRKFPASAEGVRDLLTGSLPEHTRVLRDDSRVVRGYSVLFPASGEQGVFNGGADFDEAVEPIVIDTAISALQESFRTVSGEVSNPSLRVFSGDRARVLNGILLDRGFEVERSFLGKRRAVTPADNVTPILPGFVISSWDQVVSRGLTERVRQAQYETFLEHFGELSKDSKAWQQHLAGPVFEPDFSFAVFEEDSADSAVVGYVLGSHYTDDSSGVREINAHTDYIGVRRKWRKKGVAAFLLRSLWKRAHDLGLPAVSLGVDIENGSNAVHLYDSLGYETVSRSSAYRYDIPAS